VGIKAILPLKRLDLVTFFNRTRPQHIRSDLVA
jgi:hypothetical protein